MKLFSFITACVLCTFATMTSQAQPHTVRGIVTAGSTANNVYVVVGQPLWMLTNNGNYEVAYGVSQSQLEKLDVADEDCENQDYTSHGFDIPASELTVGNTNYELYSLHVDEIYGYDRITKLALSVWPTYATEASETYHGTLPIINGSELQDGTDYQVVEGDNIINYSSIHGCDSVVTLHVLLCPYTVKDADSNEYNTVVLDQFCWTQSNLMTTHYYGDDHVQVPYALVYSPNENVNESIYGRLYTWYSAVNTPEGSNIAPATDEDGFVRGICPAGWHIPAIPEITSLESHTSDELHSLNYWIVGAGINSSEFTMLPAGFYNSSTGRFERLGLSSFLWNIINNTTSEPAALGTTYYCDSFFAISPILGTDAYSVRCVKNY